MARSSGSVAWRAGDFLAWAPDICASRGALLIGLRLTLCSGRARALAGSLAGLPVVDAAAFESLAESIALARGGVALA